MPHALYYPTIEFQDQEFLKKSILVWDRIFRIVPPSYLPNDDEDIKEAASAGVIENLNIDAIEKSNAAQGFLDFYHLRQSENTRLSWPAGFSSSSFARLNMGKIDAKLLPLFEELSRRVASDGFLEIPGELAGGYMFYLATAVAERRNIHLLTDSPESWTVGSYFAQKGNFNDEEYLSSANAYLCNLAVDDLLPDTLREIPMEAVLRFVEKHADERRVFQQELDALKNEISKCNNKQHAEYIVRDFIKKFERAKSEYKKVIAPFSKREFCSIFSGGLAATMGLLALPLAGGATGDPYDAVRLSSGLLIGAVAALATREMIPLNKGVGSYLVSAEKMGSAPNWRLHRDFHEFIND
ncbi:hypothetical protein [Collimonas fungivorans]|uniref:hypothetical protein n=1 Tax=Collimonas fungivorans TaxID=158899 RepID=UPI003FA348AA